MNIFAIVVFVLMFSVLILIHELGHFWAARRAGVRVDEFGLGLPPRLWGKKRGDTIFSINWIPFGGFVKLQGDNDAQDITKFSLQGKSYLQRFWVITGGVLMNFLLAYVVIAIGMWLSMPPLAADVDGLVSDPSQIVSEVIVLGVEKDSPAQAAGLLAGDRVVSIDGQAIRTVEELRSAVSGAEQIEVVIARDGQEQSVEVTTRVQDDGTRVVGVFSETIVQKVEYEWWKVPYLALVDLSVAIARVAEGVGQFVAGLVQTGKIDEAVSGPVGIAQITSYAVGLGLLPVLQLLAFLSINLGLINLLPFPALDGGRLVFLIAEIVTGGRRVKPVVESAVHNIGFLLLLILIVVVTYRDIVKLF